jgi:hypothetical protein
VAAKAEVVRYITRAVGPVRYGKAHVSHRLPVCTGTLPSSNFFSPVFPVFPLSFLLNPNPAKPKRVTRFGHPPFPLKSIIPLWALVFKSPRSFSLPFDDEF